jgi:signal transduction histidine kinase
VSGPRGDRSGAPAGWIGVAALAAAAVTAVLAWQQGRPLPAGELLRAGATRYEELWEELEALAEAAARQPGSTPFADLEAALEGRARGRSLFIVDRFGEVVAWAGEGVAHELPPVEPFGRKFRAGFSAVTLLVTRPLARDGTGGAVVAGASFPTDGLPFRLPRDAHRGVVWTLAEPQAPRAPEAVVLEAGGGPVLVLRRPRDGGSPLDPRLATLSLALLATSAACVWAWSERRPGVRWVAAGGGVGCAAAAAGAGGPISLVAALAGAAAAAAWQARPRPSGAGRAALLGAAAAAATLGLAIAAQRWRGPWDPGVAFLGGDGAVAALRFALFLAAFGAWSAVGALAAPTPSGPPLGWKRRALGVALLAGAAASVRWPAPSGGALVAAAALLGRWAAALGARPPAVRAALLALLAALTAGVAGEVSHQAAASRRLPDLLAAMAPPGREELAEAAEELRRFLATADLASLTPGDPRRLLRSDLAYVLWRRAPLRHERALSGLRVEPLAAEASEFALGLALADGELREASPLAGGTARTPVWDFALVAEEGILRWRGEPWARVRAWLLPQPGFGLPGRDSEGLSRRLFRGGPGVPRTVERLLAPARYALFGRDAVPLISPSRVAVELPEDLRSGGSAVVAGPDGPARALAATEPDGTRLLLLPRPTALDGWERVGTAVTGVLLLAGVLGLAGAALRSTDPAFRAALARPLASYSMRLVVVFSLLVLLPAVALNSLILGAMARRLENEQRAAGEAALEAAERVLSDYAAAQAPGVGIDTVLDDELLTWLSQVLRTDVNLYFGGTLYATSKRELFTAGLLPRRVPGEIHERLSLLGHRHASRSSHAGNVSYREIYAPLLVPGMASAPSSLLVSVPLVAEQEQLAEELAAIRRKVVVATAGLVLLLAALGARLARGFTAPLTAILEGTRRIATGASSLGLPAPRVVELSTLVEAIDRMAGRLAEGRQQLLREKRVVEQMVEHSTAAVVSLDDERRVLLQNRLAASLLGTGVGESLPERLAGVERLTAVAAFVAGPPKQLRRATVRLPAATDAEPREWSLVWVPIRGDGAPATLFVVEDVSDVLRVQRWAAWAEMARIIAHEIKNPLTPIRLSAEHMREVRGRDPQQFEEVFERCTANILRHVDELQAIASEFSIYSHLPRTELKEGDLAEFVERLVEGYRAAPPRGVVVEVAPAPGEIRARFDARLLGRALRNLLENALRATAGGGRVLVRVRRFGNEVEVEVEDDGPGVAPDDLDRIFEPYFSTHDSGTGLGLPIARRIAEEHGGRLVARNREAGGLRVTMTWPAT